MRALASLICGYVFGWGLFISGMMRPDKVLSFLDVFAIPSGGWDPSLAVVMAAALVVTGIGYALARRRTPAFTEKNEWPTQSAIDRPLVAGSILFGAGWGLVGLCPGPAVANLSTLSTPVIVFVVAMALGTLAHDLWYARSPPEARRRSRRRMPTAEAHLRARTLARRQRSRKDFEIASSRVGPLPASPAQLPVP